MNSIAFKNFRRFTDFPTLEYGGITMLVGKNNSGKSTMVKALLLVNEFLKSGNISVFSLGNEHLENANIVTFDRAKTKKSKNPIITFCYSFDNYKIQISITGEDGKTNTAVTSYIIEQNESGLTLKIEPISNSITLISKQTMLNDNFGEYDEIISTVRNQLTHLKEKKNQIKGNENSLEYIDLNNTIISFEKKIIYLIKLKNADSKKNSDYTISSEVSSFENISSSFNEFILHSNNKYDELLKSKKTSKTFKNYRNFKEDKFIIEKIFNQFINRSNRINYIYLGANPAKQSALFAIRDKNNALAQAIHEYKQLNIDKEMVTDAYQFIVKWMKLFEVGDFFTAKLHAGEAYEVLVSDKGSQIALSDKGMGSIQAMLLIVRLGCIIAKAQKFNKDYTVIIEEPELNLHPALQSKLADLFHEVYINFKIKLIIETHSEYLIRKTQLIVKEKEYEVKPNVNPFYTYYFDIDKGQWKMNYREDGKFIDEFGSGFYDESAILTLNLL